MLLKTCGLAMVWLNGKHGVAGNEQRCRMHSRRLRRKKIMINLTRSLIRRFVGVWEAATKGTGCRPAIIRYSIGIFAGAAAVAIRLLLVPWIGVAAPYVILYPAALLIALALGVGPGLTAAVVGLAVSELTLVPLASSPISVGLVPRRLIVIFGAILVGYVGGKLRQARRAAEAQAAERARLNMKLADASDRERREIAAWLHDNIGQMLTALGLSLDEAVRNGPLPDRALRSIREAEEVLGQVTDQVRNMTYELDSPVLRKLGLDDALNELCEDVGSRFDLQCIYQSNGDVTASAKEIDGVLYDAVRELLHNVVKHAGARRADVRATCTDGHIRIAVEDDGRGFDRSVMTNSFSRNGGFGLYRMQERIGHLGGTFQLATKENGGTRVTIEMPKGPPSSQERP